MADVKSKRLQSKNNRELVCIKVRRGTPSVFCQATMLRKEFIKKRVLAQPGMELGRKWTDHSVDQLIPETWI